MEKDTNMSWSWQFGPSEGTGQAFFYDNETMRVFPIHYFRLDDNTQMVECTMLHDNTRQYMRGLPDLSCELEAGCMPLINLDPTTMLRIAEYNKTTELKNINAKIKQSKEKLNDIKEQIKEQTEKLNKLQDFCSRFIESSYIDPFEYANQDDDEEYD